MGPLGVLFLERYFDNSEYVIENVENCLCEGKAQIGGCLGPLGPWVEIRDSQVKIENWISSLSMAIRKYISLNYCDNSIII